jgi:hypothetical protein
MRRFFTGFAVAALMAVLPTLALAGNQEVADQIAQKLRASGQMNGYKIRIKCQDGTVWLRGQVASEEQLNGALKLAFQTAGVKRVVNELSLAEPSEPVADNAPQNSRQASNPSQNPLRGLTQGLTTRQPQKPSFVKRLESVITRSSDQSTPAQAERVANTFHPAPVTRVSAEEAQEEEMPQTMRAPAQARPMAVNRVAYNQGPTPSNGRPLPMYTASANHAGAAPARYDQPCMPNYAWPSYAAYPNYAAVTYPKQYSPTAWPYIGPFYPYPQVPLGWRKVTLQWDDGWWFLDFKDQPSSCWHR